MTKSRKKIFGGFEEAGILQEWLDAFSDLIWILPVMIFSGDDYGMAVACTVTVLYLVRRVFAPAIMHGIRYVTDHCRRTKPKALLQQLRASLITAILSGIFVWLCFFVLAGPLTNLILSPQASLEQANTVRNVFKFVTPAVIPECAVYAFYGFSGGIRDNVSRREGILFEQLVRIGAILILIVVLKKFVNDYSSWMVYAVSVGYMTGSFVCIERYRSRIVFQGNESGYPVGKASARIFARTLPYLVIKGMEELWMVFELLFGIRFLISSGLSYTDAIRVVSLLIPLQVLLCSLLFVLSAHGTTSRITMFRNALSARDGDSIETDINRALFMTVFTAMPISLFLYFQSGNVMTAFFGENMSEYADVFGFASLFSLLYVLENSAACFLRKTDLHVNHAFYLLFGAVLELVAMRFLPQKYAYSGIAVSAMIGMSAVIFLDAARLKNHVLVEYGEFLRKTLFCLLACVAMEGVCAGWTYLGLLKTESGTPYMPNLLVMAILSWMMYRMACDVMKLKGKRKHGKTR